MSFSSTGLQNEGTYPQSLQLQPVYTALDTRWVIQWSRQGGQPRYTAIHIGTYEVVDPDTLQRIHGGEYTKPDTQWQTYSGKYTGAVEI